MANQNTTDVNELIKEIKGHLKAQTGSWVSIAACLNRAETEYGFASDAMRKILKQTDISVSKASKLISISKDKRLDNRIFDTVSAWTTLYEATRLTDKEMYVLKENATDEILTMRDIAAAKDKSATAPKSTYQNLINIQFDWNAIKAQTVSHSDIQDVIEKLEELASEISYMKVEMAGKYENELTRYNAEVVKEYYKAAKKYYREKEKDYRKQYKLKIGARIGNYDAEEIRGLLNDNDLEALFENIGIYSEFEANINNLQHQAQNEVDKKRDKRYKNKIATPDEEYTASVAQDLEKSIKAVNKNKKRIGRAEIKL